MRPAKMGWPGSRAACARQCANAVVRVQLACPGPMDTPHATRYAPEGSSAKGRMSPERAAQAVAAQFVVLLLFPALGPKLAVLAGRVAPQSMTRLMGRVLFSKLK